MEAKKRENTVETTTTAKKNISISETFPKNKSPYTACSGTARMKRKGGWKKPKDEKKEKKKWWMKNYDDEKKKPKDGKKEKPTAIYRLFRPCKDALLTVSGSWQIAAQYGGADQAPRQPS